MSVAALRRVVRPSRPPSSAHGVAAVGVTRLLDAASTLVGLALVPTLEEANPFARAVFESIGALPGLVMLSVIAIVAVTLVTELGVVLIDDSDTPVDGSAVRYLGYGVPSVLSLAAAVHNVHLVVSVAVV